jgi:hypothetical protein
MKRSDAVWRRDARPRRDLPAGLHRLATSPGALWALSLLLVGAILFGVSRSMPRRQGVKTAPPATAPLAGRFRPLSSMVDGSDQDKGEVARDAGAFLDAIVAKRWERAGTMLSARIPREQVQRLVSSHFMGKQAGQAGSLLAVIHSPVSEVTRCVVRGDRGWCLVQVSWPTARVSSAGCTLEMVREAGGWRILAIPPSRLAYCAALAGLDGQAAGAWLAAMLGDGRLSGEEQALLSGLIALRRDDGVPVYYALSVEWMLLGSLARCEIFDRADMATIRRIIADRPPRSVLAGATFWRSPGPRLAGLTRPLARDAMLRIYLDLLGEVVRFPELAGLNQSCLNLKELRIDYAPPRARSLGQVSRPSVLVTIDGPELGTVKREGASVTFPVLRLEVTWKVAAADPGLARFVRRKIEEEADPLMRLDGNSGGRPLRRHGFGPSVPDSAALSALMEE